MHTWQCSCAESPVGLTLVQSLFFIATILWYRQPWCLLLNQAQVNLSNFLTGRNFLVLVVCKADSENVPAEPEFFFRIGREMTGNPVLSSQFSRYLVNQWSDEWNTIASARRFLVPIALFGNCFCLTVILFRHLHIFCKIHTIIQALLVLRLFTAQDRNLPFRSLEKSGSGDKHH